MSVAAQRRQGRESYDDQVAVILGNTTLSAEDLLDSDLGYLVQGLNAAGEVVARSPVMAVFLDLLSQDDMIQLASAEGSRPPITTSTTVASHLLS